MKNLIEYYELTMEYLNAIGIYPNRCDKVYVSKAQSRWGQCGYKTINGRKSYYININEWLLDDRCDEKALLESLAHECLHAVDGCMNHGEKWKKLAELVNDCYDIDITRTKCDEEKLNEEVRQARMEAIPTWAIRCQKCGALYTKHSNRRPNWYIDPSRYHCSAKIDGCKCGGELARA